MVVPGEGAFFLMIEVGLFMPAPSMPKCHTGVGWGQACVRGAPPSLLEVSVRGEKLGVGDDILGV